MINPPGRTRFLSNRNLNRCLATEIRFALNSNCGFILRPSEWNARFQAGLLLVLVHERVMIAFKTRSFEIITHLVNIDGHFHHIFFIIAIFPNKKTL
jgi:hypothetical protein